MHTLFGPGGMGAVMPQPLTTTDIDILGGSATIPSRDILLQSMYSRSGPDLVLTSPENGKFVVKGFFLSDTPPRLTDGGETHISGELATQFAGSIAPNQYAGQTGGLGAPIGQVRSLVGVAEVTRADGTVVVLKVGDSVYVNDTIETKAGAKLGLVLIDGMTLALGEKGELVLDELVYDPSTKGGKQILTLVSGAAEFVSGTIAKSGQDHTTFKTPVGTVGIRGTRVFVSYDPVTGDVSILNRPTGVDAAGNITAGEIVLTLPNGQVIGNMTAGNGGWQWNPTQGQAPQNVQLTDAQVAGVIAGVEGIVNNIQQQQQQQQQQNIQQGGGQQGGDAGTGSPGGTSDSGTGTGTGDSGAGTGTGTGDAGTGTTTGTSTGDTGTTTTPTTTVTVTNTATNTATTTVVTTPPASITTFNVGPQLGASTGTTTPQTTVTPPPPPPPQPQQQQLATFSVSGGGSVSDATANVVVFTVTREGNTSVFASVNYSVQGVSAEAGSDFTPVSGTITFAAGQTSADIVVPILANARGEPDETFTITLSGSTAGSIIVGGSASATILADLLLPSLMIDSVSIADSGATTAVLTVTRSGSLTQSSSVAYQTAGGSAQVGIDFSAVSGVINFAPGQTTAQIEIPIIADASGVPLEKEELFQVELFNASNGIITKSVGTVTITADIAATFSIDSASVAEGASVILTVTRGGYLSRSVSVNYSTQDGTAIAGSDYQSATGTLTFGPNQTTQTITIPILKDSVVETAESFSVVLGNPLGGDVVGSPGTVSITLDPPLPTLSVSDVSISDTAAGSAGFVVTLSAVSTIPVTFNYTTQAGSATAGSDFTPRNGTVTIPAGQTSITIDVPVLANANNEPTEIFSVVLSGANGATIAKDTGVGTITADIIVVPVINVNNVTVSDASPTTALFEVTLSAPTTVTVTVDFSTQTGTANSSDLVAQSGTLTFAPGIVRRQSIWDRLGRDLAEC